MSEYNHKDSKDTKLAPSFYIDRLAHTVIGAAIAVHRTLGPGFLESVYESVLSVELRFRSVPFRTQVPIPLYYRGYVIGESRLDLVVDEMLIVELKSVEVFAPKTQLSLFHI